ncbi:MAG TPA: bifunctional diaminohydroxyphosphoribosylaminopyrimidine deaminase/5-amino-6-(5-phosphoribosylamino)uracil reductase RibD [Candidatus Krumholzibacteria bacterium]|nr:bifunctional diaminohydroxyphosphoribosylaminopyrimidine deaminase/5-amino-6-(5-phosphoribosylamino)uracil reductase RibD [Candidatus Krumholzibacteria bacterium]HPD72756.1 bifunctional diaminohydroxyphosphoribosylaminopyrimidine deaminase/5-amino-6-(5-phosphoribosylamino)uracil reductase RibD [Candidatus Krumholzibacteria bacterium]HRY40312.1 bifunctional diaminohydroxyphosphoribosylaminopyrimidine deaminase/5-amino-6-(5-phosphoribosylamino)uracil reductase RibD [Candidatus Krumholzibacteria 
MSGARVQASLDRVDEDRRYLREALGLAARVPARPWPNPPVGAVVVKDGVTVGRGAHHGPGEPHAERVALAEAGGRAAGATLYCTLEPCRHHGRTPPCVDAILAAGVARVVIGLADPNPLAGGGAARLRAAGVGVDVGPCGAECLDLVWPFVATDCFARPYLELKTATSLDARFAAPARASGGSRYLTGPQARADVHARRRWVDLVLVGKGTAVADRPRLDTRLVPAGAACPAAEPAAGCVAGADLAGVSLARPAWLLFQASPAPAVLPPGAERVACPPATGGGVDPAGLVDVCRERGWRAIMLEGGPRLAASFLAAGLVDRWVQYVAPVVGGGGATWPAGFAAPGGSFHLTRCDRVGADLRVIWDRRDFAATLASLTDSREATCSPD